MFARVSFLLLICRRIRLLRCGFVVFLELGDLGEPVVFAVDGTHVANELVEVKILNVVVFVRHVLNIKII